MRVCNKFQVHSQSMVTNFLILQVSNTSIIFGCHIQRSHHLPSDKDKACISVAQNC